ncbi:hypothetical protein HNQ10_000630 [Deinococcus metallilatus]|uniref:Uncharacterized protein n=1 Tax=Deinococcus metallilatus TaxID=1211322 RepID=A0ABR6MS71_9DEIO|nr:hypothetical protein [Deinococcus metallilatus]
MTTTKRIRHKGKRKFPRPLTREQKRERKYQSWRHV